MEGHHPAIDVYGNHVDAVIVRLGLIISFRNTADKIHRVGVEPQGLRVHCLDYLLHPFDTVQGGKDVSLHRKQDGMLLGGLHQLFQAVDEPLHHMRMPVLRMRIPRPPGVEAARPYVQEAGPGAAGYQTHALHRLDARLPLAFFRVDEVRVDGAHLDEFNATLCHR